ncbi:low temperature requirement protein A [Micromonospora soli]|uniref:low temperature requirement protein A n=1 Tax=Micromonospora sp. NBRC 110009 TaxID=3061627 RepID=UPI00267109A3|nr:low temperature requirement protein A [Micromonospora sp. NBRC 110009]WKT97837.1 low temperature requirement protein A [Micromonospora sp. NBRC 110009]
MAETGSGPARAARLLREGGGPSRATFLELFFDLIFVFALARISERLVDDFVSAGPVLAAAGQTTVLLLAIWLVWLQAAWVTSRYDPDRPAIELIIVGIMLGTLLMAVATPEAFRSRAPVFAVAYVAVQVGRSLVLVILLRGHEQQRIPARLLWWSAVSAVPWLAGAALAPGAATVALWTFAVALDYLALLLGWPTPRLGPSRIGGWRIAAEHLADRYQQFLIIALGEAFALVGLAFGRSALTPDRTVGFLVAFASTVLLWRVYFFRAGFVLREAVAVARRPAKLSEVAAYTHLAMVAGILATAVGHELVIDEPHAHRDPAWLSVILGGPALFISGRTWLEQHIFGRMSRPRLAGLIALPALAPVLALAPPLVATSVATLVLAGVALADAVQERRRPPGRAMPPG